jgi:peptidoglycan L-alanyl-D-glutamate endopeptidase CwlK
MPQRRHGPKGKSTSATSDGDSAHTARSEDDKVTAIAQRDLNSRRSAADASRELAWTRPRIHSAIEMLVARQADFELHEHLKRAPRLDGMHPQLMKQAALLLGAMQACGFPMMITDGLRTLEEQQALYAKGRTIPGKIVTYADGVHNRSNHQSHDDGLGHALDCTFLNTALPAPKPFWPTDAEWMKRWKAYGKLSVALGLQWGGDWQRPDIPHIQLA